MEELPGYGRARCVIDLLSRAGVLPLPIVNTADVIIWLVKVKPVFSQEVLSIATISSN